VLFEGNTVNWPSCFDIRKSVDCIRDIADVAASSRPLFSNNTGLLEGIEAVESKISATSQTIM